MKNIFLLLLLWLLASGGLPAQNSIRVGWIQEGLDPAEKQGLNAFFESQPDIAVEPMRLEQIADGALRNPSLTHLFWHRNTLDLPTDDLSAAHAQVREFAANGGQVILTMEAARFLFDWGFEDRPLELRTDTVRDDGYGIPLGFHAFKRHPLFEGLHGGAVTWKSPQGHFLRKWGFFETNPAIKGKVAGIDWSYITFHRDRCIVLEYPFGNGRVIAVGAYLYYGKPNLNRAVLEQFTGNLFRYKAGPSDATTTRYWNETMAPLISEVDTAYADSLRPAKLWSLPEPALAVKSTQPDDFFDLSGRRLTIMGTARAGIREIWVHPFLALKGYEVGVRDVRGGIFWLQRLSPEVTVTPEMVTRIYRFETFVLKEVISVSPDQPIAVIHYESTRALPLQMVFRIASNMRYMWPYAPEDTRGIQRVLATNLNAVILTAQDGDLNTIVGFSEPALDITGNPRGLIPFDTSAWDQTGLYELTLDPAKGAVDVRIAAGSEGIQEAAARFRTQLAAFENIPEQSHNHYQRLLDKHLLLETPDTDFNQGYQWAIVKTDQLMVETPGVGRGMMAGFGTTDQGWDGNQTPSGRPGYAWYFGRDGIWCAFAMAAYGDREGVRNILDMLVRYQDPSGKIFHELTSSGVAHYDAADATPLFVVLAGKYLRYSGDIAYIQSIWPAILAAINYCMQTDTDGDGWIENTGAGHGWVEGGKLFGVHTEFYLAGCWSAALDQAAYMASRLGDGNAQTFLQMAARCKTAISNDFWNPGSQFFYHGKRKDGTYQNDATVLAAVPVYLNAVTDEVQVKKTAERFAGMYFTADWGVRMIEKNNPNYYAQGYHSGSVWPLFGGWASLAEYKAHRATNAFEHIQRTLLQYRHWGLGSREEVLDGDTYTPRGVCHHQGWSETMVLLPALEGMLGLEPDAANRTLNMHLRLPWHWNDVKIHNIQVGDAVFSLHMNRIDNKTFYTFIGQGQPKLKLNLRLQLAPGSVPIEVESHHQPAEITESDEGTFILLPDIPVKPGETIAVEATGGIGIIPGYIGNIPGEPSQGLRFTGQAVHIDDGWYSATFEGVPGKTYRTRIFIQNGYKNMENATVIGQDGQVYELEVAIPAGAGDRGKVQIRVEF